MAIELYWGSGSPFAWRVMLTLEVKGLAYESKLLEFSKGDHKTPAYLKLNPRGKVPTLKDGDFVLYESLAIMSYLDRKYPDPPLFGKTAEETGLIWRALAECECYMLPAGDKLVRPIFFNKGLDKVEEIQQAAETLQKLGVTILCNAMVTEVGAKFITVKHGSSAERIASSGAGTPVQMMMDHANTEPEPPSRCTELPVPPELDALILSLLRKQRDARPASAAEVIARLDGIPLDRPWDAERARQWWDRHRPSRAWPDRSATPEDVGPVSLVRQPEAGPG